MKLWAHIVCLIILLFAWLDGGEIDLGKPSHRKADRTLTLKRIFTIRGDAVDYFLKNPSNPLFLEENQGLLLLDKEQLLHFNNKGEFMGNLQRVGEGPGEWADSRSILTNDKGICVVCDSPGKLLFLDKQFKFQKEIRFDKNQNWLRVLWATTSGGSFLSAQLDFAKANTGVKKLLVEHKYFNAQGQVTNGPLSFSHRIYMNVIRPKEGGIVVQMQMVDPFWYAVIPGKNRMLINDLETYRLHLVDQQNEKILKTMTRIMPRKVWFKDDLNQRKSSVPDPEYFADISALVTCGDKVWVFTSDIDEKKGVMVDVIGSDGEYLDRFRLPLPGLLRPEAYYPGKICVNKDKIAWVHQDEEQNPVVSVFSFNINP